MDLPKIIRLVTVVVAVVAGLWADMPEAGMIIAILGLATGYFVEADRRVAVMVLALTLATVHGALGDIHTIGVYLSAILGSLSAAASAAACTVIVMEIVERVKP